MQMKQNFQTEHTYEIQYTHIAGKLGSDQCTKIEVLVVASKFSA